ncbi:MAG: glycoside hydrolase family 16 protein [Marinilabiliaceae bacterium]
MAGILEKLFGSKFPDTQKFEAKQDQHRSDFARFQEIGESPLYKRYKELDALVHSGDFEKRADELKHKKFKDTKEHQQLQRYKQLKKDPDIKTWLKLYHSGKIEKIKEVLNSEEFQRFRELEKYLNTPEFLKAKASPDFKNTEAYQAYQEYKKLRKKKRIKWAAKMERSSSYQTFLRIEGSDRLNEFFELQSIVNSQEFKEFKENMEDPHKFKKSNEAAQLKEFSELKKHKDIVWYLRKEEEKPFEELKKWTLTFEDDFDQAQLDTSKWMTGYYWGKALMNDNYSLEGEKQLLKDQNVELRDSCLRITTQKETVKGKVWSPTWGFREKDFDYTSGLVSTGQSFRQQYGYFEAKVRFNQAFPVMNAFWMVGERITPHIDVFKSMYPGGRLLEAGLIAEVPEKGLSPFTARITGARFTKDFFIYSLDWSQDRIIWKINGVEVFRVSQHIPREPMYITFCTTLPEEPDDRMLPAVMEINWVRCYQRK